MTTPLNKQIDGHHYTDQYLQPVEAAYLLNATPCWCKLDKYLTRIKGDKLTNLEKALHCIELEEHFEYGIDEKLAKLLGFKGIYLEKELKIVSNGYLNKVCDKFLQQIVSLCTDKLLYREALVAMYRQDYRLAKKLVKQCIRELEINNNK